MSGEPYWIREPSHEYLAADGGLSRDDFTSLAGTAEIARNLGFSLVWMQASTMADWDRYEMMQLASVDEFARESPDHPDLPEIRRRVEAASRVYLRWGRETCGSALWVFRSPV